MQRTDSVFLQPQGDHFTAPRFNTFDRLLCRPPVGITAASNGYSRNRLVEAYKSNNVLVTNGAFRVIDGRCGDAGSAQRVGARARDTNRDTTRMLGAFGWVAWVDQIVDTVFVCGNVGIVDVTDRLNGVEESSRLYTWNVLVVNGKPWIIIGFVD